MEGIREQRGLAIRVLGGLTLLMCAFGVTAVVSRSGAGGNHVVKASAEPAASTATVPPPTAPTEPAVSTTAPPATTTTAVPRKVSSAVTTVTTSASSQIFGVVGHQGTPVAGAKVDLTAAGVAARTTETGADGRYSFDAVRPGTYDVVLYAESAPAPCAPGGPCIGTAVSMQRQPVDVAAAHRYEVDWEYPYGS